MIGIGIGASHPVSGKRLNHALADEAIVHPVAGDNEGMERAAIPIARRRAALSVRRIHHAARPQALGVIGDGGGEERCTRRGTDRL
jgi:hypothetical protein